LPPKDGEGKWKQYEVRTGCFAGDNGYKAALAKAQKMESDLIFERFQWSDWGDKPRQEIKNNIETAINSPSQIEVLVPDRTSEIIELTTIDTSYILCCDFLIIRTKPIDNEIIAA
jgi:hypothetical protein